MKNFRSIGILLLSAFVSLSSLAQTKLNMQQAFALTLEQNFSVQIAKNELDMSKRNNVIGNAGMLPVLAGTINQDNQVMDTKQKFLSGTENNRNGARSNQLNAGVELSWTVFNGMKMFATKSRLEEIEAIGELKLRQQMENTLSRVAKSYLDISLIKAQIETAKTFIGISEKRLEVAKVKVMSGKSAKSEVLIAQVNLNSDLAALKKLETQLKNAKLSLIQLMGLSIDYNFDIADSLVPNEHISFQEIHDLAIQNNSALRMAKVNQTIANLQMREIKSERFPTLQVKSGYNLSNQQSQAGFLQSSNTAGYHFGAGLNLNIFNGFDVNRRIGNARLTYKNSELLYKDSLLKLDIALTQAYNVYVNNLDLYKFEQSNLEVAQQNFDISKEQNDHGMISSNDLRIAQVNVVQNMNRLLQAAYDAKSSEIELKRLSGNLLKE